MIKRLYFEKLEEMQYISHRDFLRFLERLFKISGLALLYSKGYHPRPKMSFGSPISIGEEALFEPFDIELRDEISNEELIKILNSKCPKGFKILESHDIDGKKSIVSTFNSTIYEIEFSNLNEKESILNLLKQDKVIESRIKDGVTKVRDLKINVVSVKETGNNIELILNNISPNAFMRIAKLDQKNIKIKRIKYLNI